MQCARLYFNIEIEFTLANKPLMPISKPHPNPRIEKIITQSELSFRKHFLLRTNFSLYVFLDKIESITYGFRFQPHQFKWGVPNIELQDVHPLTEFGLQDKGIYKVLNSPWMDEYFHYNIIVKGHSDYAFGHDNHYIIKFEDSIFEIISTGVEEVQLNEAEISAIAIEGIDWLANNAG